MISRTTWVLVVIFVVLIGMTMFLQRSVMNESKVHTPIPERALLEFNEGDIVKMWIEDREANAIELYQAESGQWVLINPSIGTTDSGIVSSAISQLINSKTLTTVDPAPEMEVFGLTEPEYMIRLETKSGKIIEMIVGNITPTESGYYINVDGDEIIVVSKFVIEAITNLIETPPVLITPIDDLETTDTATP